MWAGGEGGPITFDGFPFLATHMESGSQGPIYNGFPETGLIHEVPERQLAAAITGRLLRHSVESSIPIAGIDSFQTDHVQVNSIFSPARHVGILGVDTSDRPFLFRLGAPNSPAFHDVTFLGAFELTGEDDAGYIEPLYGTFEASLAEYLAVRYMLETFSGGPSRSDMRDLRLLQDRAAELEEDLIGYHMELSSSMDLIRQDLLTARSLLTDVADRRWSPGTVAIAEGAEATGFAESDISRMHEQAAVLGVQALFGDSVRNYELVEHVRPYVLEGSPNGLAFQPSPELENQVVSSRVEQTALIRRYLVELIPALSNPLRHGQAIHELRREVQGIVSRMPLASRPLRYRQILAATRSVVERAIDFGGRQESSSLAALRADRGVCREVRERLETDELRRPEFMARFLTEMQRARRR